MGRLSTILTRLDREGKTASSAQIEVHDGIPDTLLQVYDRFRSHGVTPPPTFRGVDIAATSEEFERRSVLLKSLSSLSGKSRAQLEADRSAELEKCAKDIVYWINTWGWTIDPRCLPGPTTLPMMLFDRQVEYVLWADTLYTDRESGFVDKCRDVGLTWLNCFILGHKFTFEPGFKGAIGSRKEILVDRLGDMDCIFEKIRFLLKRLPLWMAPYLSAPRVTIETSMKMVNPALGSAITGEAGDNIGRGGRNSLYFVDEAAYLSHPQKVEAALSQNSPCILWVSTTNIHAPGNLFDQKVMSGNHKVFTFDWWQDKRKDEQWLENQRRNLDPLVFATEVMRDRNSGLSNQVILREWIEAAIDFPLSGGVRRAGLDIADGGNDLTVLTIGSWPKVDSIKKVECTDPDPVKTAGIVAGICRQEGVDELRYDAIGVGSGCGGAWKAMQNINFKVYKFLAGGETSRGSDEKPLYIEEFERTSDQCYANAKAEAWWEARQRFYKTWLMVNGVQQFPDSELVSIPRHPKLIEELATPTWKTTLRGLIAIESKDELKKRGIKSPDYAESLIIFLWDKNQEEDSSWIGKFTEWY